jgi:hypothetical protein
MKVSFLPFLKWMAAQENVVNIKFYLNVVPNSSMVIEKNLYLHS